MAYDEVLAERIRDALGPVLPDVTERKMFGGLGFMVSGNMAVAASGQGGLLARVDPAETPELLCRDFVATMVMGGREMRNWLRVDAAALEDDAALEEWVGRSVAYARTLPPK
ncbi:Regulator of competence-specific genes [Nocardia otitidiscaviarum]|uniref:Regulator of competence-specific genes n=1 Tax=Nocardia otitidiscaviarum TaxID=1823 RepID=A0A379JKR8_9NOCA|nr:TfoX/Sxy family protein [Nocardia otitidiscaviarum]SUD49020.1 Regulator of competence-specific genes [Nocardia otitidiscaviarum]